VRACRARPRARVRSAVGRWAVAPPAGMGIRWLALGGSGTGDLDRCDERRWPGRSPAKACVHRPIRLSVPDTTVSRFDHGCSDGSDHTLNRWRKQGPALIPLGAAGQRDAILLVATSVLAKRECCLADQGQRTILCKSLNDK
jgi:hypothetical protein